MPKKYQKPEVSLGKIYGKLTILSIVCRDSRGQAIVKCKCKCGITKEIRLASIKVGKTKSCGCTNKSKSVSPGEVINGFKILSIGHNLIFPSMTVAACKVKCVKCGTLAIKRTAKSQFKYKGCIVCRKRQSTDRSISSRPSVGIVFGTRTVVANDLWKHQTNGSRFAACKVRCSCGLEEVVRVTGLRHGNGCKHCSNPLHTLDQPAPQRLMAMQKGKDMANKATTHYKRSRLLEYVINKTKPTRKEHAPILKVLTSREVEIAVPSDLNIPCVWPWDDFGNPLSDAELKKAVRKAKREWKKTHGSSKAV